MITYVAIRVSPATAGRRAPRCTVCNDPASERRIVEHIGSKCYCPTHADAQRRKDQP